MKGKESGRRGPRAGDRVVWQGETMRVVQVERHGARWVAALVADDEVESSGSRCVFVDLLGLELAQRERSWSRVEGHA